jgi:hypothetical protein
MFLAKKKGPTITERKMECTAKGFKLYNTVIKKVFSECFIFS